MRGELADQVLTDRRPGRCPDEQRRERNPTPGSRSPARGSTAVVALSPGRWWSWVKAAKLETLPGELWRTRSPFWSVKPHVASVPSTRVLPQHNYSHFFRELFYFHDLQLTGPSELGKSLREHPQTHFCPAGPRRSAATCALHWSLRVPKGSNPDLGDEQRSSRLREQGDRSSRLGLAWPRGRSSGRQGSSEQHPGNLDRQDAPQWPGSHTPSRRLGLYLNFRVHNPRGRGAGPLTVALREAKVLRP